MFIGRRKLLRGLAGGTAVAVGLPPLEAMLNGNGTAFADGSAIPRRFGLWFFGNGVKRDHWTPAQTGTAWQASPPDALQPLADVIDYVSVVSRTWNPFEVAIAHHSAYWGLMTASEPLGDDDVPTKDGGGYPNHGEGPKAIDVIAQGLSGEAKLERITPHISRGAAGADYLQGDTDSSDFNPQALHQLLFADYMPTDQPPNPGLVAAKRSVLDAVAEDASSLRSRLGMKDRARLDQHLDHIAAIESSLDAVAEACAVPADPGPRPDDLDGNGEHLEEINEAMSNLVAYALACDITRTFDLTFSRLQGYPHFWQVGASEGHHELGHNEPGDQPKIQATVVFMMQQLGVLLKKLKAIPVADDNLLDHCCIWVTSEQNDPGAHGTFDTPNLVIGRAGGALRGGVHHDAGGDPDWHHRLDVPEAIHAGLVLTMMQAVGLDATSFGVGDGRSSTVMTPLLL
ncbi:MAG TPA: DUF1552 domain-containing protein [Nannocystaceae bacterium]|nr:DUF1552 domain-containing protein [Nannocystaceae bacterium]